MIDHQRPDVIGHLDKIKMYNRGRYFSEDDPWYVSLVDETLDLIRQKGSIVEVNTRGLYKKRSDTLFPGPAILEKIQKLGIPVTLSSDAHKPHELSLQFEETTSFLVINGFRHLMNMTKNGWVAVSLG